MPNQLDRPRKKEIFEVNEKIISKFVGKKLAFCYDNEKNYVINTGVVIYHKEKSNLSVKYILGILNSKLSRYYFNTIFTDFRNIFPIVKSGHLEKLPIKNINIKNNYYENIIISVDKILELHERLHKTKNPLTQKQIQRRINNTDKKIDQLVYDLYGLTEEEIKVVEESVR